MGRKLKSGSGGEASFVRDVDIDASASKVFDAVTTLEGLRGWWTPFVEGRPTEGGDVRFEFEGLSQHIVMHVEEARPAELVAWTCVVHSALPEWAGTRVIWNLRPLGQGRCALRLEHVGLVPALDCYDHCEVGWDHFLASVGAYVERGAGTPYRSTGSGTCETGLGKSDSDETLAVVRAYHRGWTAKRFDEAASTLAPDLEVEVPVNHYPTAASFAQALGGFGSLVKRVDLLSELSSGEEAMLLYDMDVEQLGSLRVAEHFTVRRGRICRIRQVHDTAALRSAGFVQG